MALDVPHPGPPPALFEFPFAHARAAVGAIRALADELDVVIACHQAAVEPARVGFAGQTRQQFDQAFEASMDGMQAHQRALDSQADQLESDIRTAEARREASLDARASWRRRHDAHQHARATAVAGG